MSGPGETASGVVLPRVENILGIRGDWKADGVAVTGEGSSSGSSAPG